MTTKRSETVETMTDTTPTPEALAAEWRALARAARDLHVRYKQAQELAGAAMVTRAQRSEPEAGPVLLEIAEEYAEDALGLRAEWEAAAGVARAHPYQAVVDGRTVTP